MSYAFDDGDGYERFMGWWSQEVANRLMAWLSPPAALRWLDVGCGTGILSQCVAERCDPSVLIGLDPSEGQLEMARRKRMRTAVAFRAGDATRLPFPDNHFDMVVASLVLNFVPDIPKALTEMHRVVRRGGTVAATVWDFADDNSPSGPLRRALRESGHPLPPVPGADICNLPSLKGLFAVAGAQDVACISFDVERTFAHFEEFWLPQSQAFPVSRTLRHMTPDQLTTLKAALQRELCEQPGDTLCYGSRIHAMKGCKQ